MKRARAALLGACAACMPVAPATAASPSGPQLAASCAACHRLVGAQGGAPTITGRPADDLVRELQSFRRGVGDNHIMITVCHALSDEEIATLARYLESIGKEDARR